jgi:MFS family permease
VADKTVAERRIRAVNHLRKLGDKQARTRGGAWIGRDFRLLLGAQFAAQAADGASQAVIANILVLEPLGQGTAARVLEVSALTLVPYSLIAPFLGVFVDRWARRSVLVVTSLARVVLLAAAIAALMGGATETTLYALALVLLGLGRLFLTAKGASLPLTLQEQHLLQGNSISGGGGMIAALIGGVVGLAAVAFTGPGPALGAAAILYLVSGAAAAAISSSMRAEHSTGPLSKEMARVALELWDGIRQAWRRSNVRLPLAAIFALRVVVIFVAIAIILVIKEQFPQGADELGRLSVSALALGVAGVGAFIGAATAPLLGLRLPRAGLVLVGFGVASAGLLTLGWVPTLTGMLALALITGYGTFVAKVAVDALVQEGMPDEYRGRAFSFYDILYNLASVVAAAVLVVFGISDALRAPLVLAGVSCVGVALALLAAFKRAGMLEPGA